MTWNQFIDGNGILGFISSALAVIGILYGIYVAGWRINMSDYKEHLGSMILDKQLMGYFVAKSPSHLSVWPIVQRKAEPPRLPTVFALIEAGDLGLFSSSMFSSMPADYSRVSWRPVYEAFFREYVWASEMTKTPSFGKLIKDESDKDGCLLKYVDKAQREVFMIKLKARRNKTYVSFSFYVPHVAWIYQASWVGLKLIYQKWTKALLWLFGHWSWLLRWRYRIIPSLAEDCPTVREILLDPEKIWNIDPHLLYYKWNLGAKFGTRHTEPPKKEVYEGPLLVSSIMPLRPVKERKKVADYSENSNSKGAKTQGPVRKASNSTGQNQHRSDSLKDDSNGRVRKLKWTTNHSKIWIHNGKPCVEVFEGELAALSVILSIIRPQVKTVQSKDQDSHDEQSKDWRGAFGTVLTSGKRGHYNTLRLVHSQREQKDVLGGGSGYSTVFAKHLACGCLPLGIAFTPGNQVVTFTIIVPRDWSKRDPPTKDVESLGYPFDHDNRVPAGAQYLRSLHSSFASVGGFPYWTWVEGDQIYDCEVLIDRSMDKPALGHYKWYPTARWSNAVAGIAFGGLVPVAADNLVDAVAYTVEVEDTKDHKDLDRITTLMELIQMHADSTVRDMIHEETPEKELRDKHVPLFGKDLEIVDGLLSTAGISESLKYWLVDEIQKTAGTAELLGRFTVILEYLIARSIDLDEDELTCKSTSTAKAEGKQPSVRTKVSEANSSSDTEEDDSDLEEEDGIEAQSGVDPRVKKAFAICAKKIRSDMAKKRKTKVNEKTKTKTKEETKKTKKKTKKKHQLDASQGLDRIKQGLQKEIALCGSDSNEPFRPSAEDCGYVAWYLIRVWTGIVQQVSWPIVEDNGGTEEPDKSEEGAGDQHKDEEGVKCKDGGQSGGKQEENTKAKNTQENKTKAKKYWPPQLNEMSYVSAWV
jgi:hypothetical protein